MTRTLFHTGLLVGLCLMAGCTEFPDLDSTITPQLEAAPYPTLVPLGPVLASAQTTGVDPDRSTAQLDARVAALKARAARLRGSVLSGRERLRLAQGLQ